MTINSLVVSSPLGPLTVFADGKAIIALDWGEGFITDGFIPEVLQNAKHQLAEYFRGNRKIFDLPLNPGGTPFQSKVWAAMQSIPYGQTQTYGDIARAIDSAPRAVGGACGTNPIPLIIPCHRVVGKNGQMTGYSGLNGVETKEWLLELENHFA